MLLDPARRERSGFRKKAGLRAVELLVVRSQRVRVIRFWLHCRSRTAASVRHLTQLWTTWIESSDSHQGGLRLAEKASEFDTPRFAILIWRQPFVAAGLCDE